MRYWSLKTQIAAAAMAFFVSIAPAGANDLRIGVEAAYKPFSWKEPDGTLKGFDIDIAMALCKQMGRTCTLVEHDWESIIPALLANKFDAIIASMSITEERKKKVAFSDKYYGMLTKFIARKGSNLNVTPDGLAGKRVGVLRGSIHQCYMEKVFPNTELVLYGTQEEVFLDLTAGRIEAQISGAFQALDGFLHTEAGEGFEFVGEDQYDAQCHGEGAGIALRKGEDELRDAFNRAIEALRADGTYARINAKYFDFDIYGAD